MQKNGKERRKKANNRKSKKCDKTNKVIMFTQLPVFSPIDYKVNMFAYFLRNEK